MRIESGCKTIWAGFALSKQYQFICASKLYFAANKYICKLPVQSTGKNTPGFCPVIFTEYFYS
jgi:hypothetical protein